MSSFGFYQDIERDSVLLIATRPSKIANSTQSLPIFVLSLNTFNEEEFPSDKTPTKNFMKAPGTTKNELSCDPHTNVPHWAHYKNQITDLKTLIDLLNFNHNDSIMKRMMFQARKPENVFELVFYAIDRAMRWKLPDRPKDMWMFKTHHFIHTGKYPLEFGFFKGSSSLSFVFKHEKTNCIVISGSVSEKDPNLILDKRVRDRKQKMSEIEGKIFKYFVDEKHFQMAEFVNEDFSLYVKDHKDIFNIIDIETFFMCVGFFGSQCYSNYPNNVPSKSDINNIMTVKIEE